MLFKYFPQLYKALFSRGLAGRYSVWKIAWDLFSENALTGIGLGNWFLVSGEALRVHNSFLNTLVDTGLLGAASLLLFYVVFIMKFFRKKGAYRDNPFLFGFFSIVIGSIVQQFFESYTLGFGGPEFTSYYFIVFFFLTVAILREKRVKVLEKR
jgi:O-antigen ligase